MRGPEMPTSWASARDTVPTPWVRAMKNALDSSIDSNSLMRPSILSTVARHFWAQPAGMS